MSRVPTVARTIGGVTRIEEVIAYIFGSMWICVKCCDGSSEEGSTATLNDLIDGYAYACDSCHVPIPRETER